MKFSDIPGLGEVKQLLVEAAKKNHIAHAQLFSGSPGALNLPLALAYASYLHCENKGDDSCGICAACSKNNKFIHPDTHFVFPVGNVKGDRDEEEFRSAIRKEWRAFLLEQPFGTPDDWAAFYGGEDKQANISREESREIVKALSLKSFESPHKVMIIWQPEYMHPAAANAILKILEEPPAKTYFILITNSAERLLPTIISRTQIVTVPLLEDEEVSRHIVENLGIPEARARRIASLAAGNLNLAVKLTQHEEDTNNQQFTEWMRACFRRNYGTLVSIADNYHGLDRMSQRNLLNYSVHMLRETMLHLAGAGAINRTRDEELKFVRDFSKAMSVEKIEKSFDLINEAAYHLERNGSAKMIFLDLSLKLSRTLNPS